MLKLNRSLTTNKSTTKFNSIQSESADQSKKRSFSLRKIHQSKELIHCSPDFSKKPNQLMKSGKVQEKQMKQKQLQQLELDLLKTQSQNQTSSLSPSPRKSRYNILNLAKLSPIKQYETKLKISAESWLVFDYRKDSYKRGWKPAEIAEYSGLVRLIVFKNNPELKNFNMRVNTYYLKQEIQMRKQEKAPEHKKKGLILRDSITRVFDNNIVINIVDLLFGLLMTNYDDILEYAIIFMGHLCHCEATKTNPVPEDSPCHYIQKSSQACTNGTYFSQYLHESLFPSLEMNSSKFNADLLLLTSTANDIARLYLSIENEELFKEIIQCKQITCKIKYQIGFKYWENRILVFKNRRIDAMVSDGGHLGNMGQFAHPQPKPTHHHNHRHNGRSLPVAHSIYNRHLTNNYEFVCCWKGKKNYSVVSRNLGLNVLVILQDCKFGMAECDIYHVEEWIRDLMKPIVDHRKTHAKLLPLLRNSENSPPKIFNMSSRLKTQKQQEVELTK